MNVKEVFVSLALKTDGVKTGLKLVDKLVDETTQGFEDLEQASEGAGEAIVHAAKTGTSEWKRFGDAHKRVVDGMGNVRPFADWGKGVASGIAVGAAALVGMAGLAGKFVADWAHGASQIESTAQQFGLSAGALQEWQYAAKAAGGEAEGIAGVFKELDLRLAEVGETGSGSAADALSLLKLRVEDLRRLKPEQQMEAIADRLSTISDVGARTFIKDSLFGGEYEKIGTLLEQGSTGIAALRNEAQQLGGVLDGEALKGAKDFNRELTKTNAVLGGVKSTIATALLPIVSDVIVRFRDWVSANRELIATKAEEWAKRLAGWVETLGPMIGGVADAVGKLVDEVGGIEPAIKLAAGGWVAWQLAGLAAINTVGAALAVFTASFAAGMALADKFAGGASERAKNKRDQEELKRFAAGTGLLLANAGDSGDPAVEKAKRLLLAELESLRQTQAGGGPNRSRQRQAAIDEQFGAVDRARAKLEAAIKESDAALTMYPVDSGGGLGKIAKPGGKAPDTADSLLAAERKAEAGRERLRQIRNELETRRASAGGSERMTIERTLEGVNKQLGGFEVRSVNQLMAEAVGQNTGFAGAELRPAGLGTSINQIDASITINMGGIEVDIPTSIIDTSNPRASAQGIGEQIAAAFSQVFGQAARLQVAQING